VLLVAARVRPRRRRRGGCGGARAKFRENCDVPARGRAISVAVGGSAICRAICCAPPRSSAAVARPTECENFKGCRCIICVPGARRHSSGMRFDTFGSLPSWVPTSPA
jgi:hypothetical protein